MLSVLKLCFHYPARGRGWWSANGLGRIDGTAVGNCSPTTRAGGQMPILQPRRSARSPGLFGHVSKTFGPRRIADRFGSFETAVKAQAEAGGISGEFPHLAFLQLPEMRR